MVGAVAPVAAVITPLTTPLESAAPAVVPVRDVEPRTDAFPIVGPASTLLGSAAEPVAQARDAVTTAAAPAEPRATEIPVVPSVRDTEPVTAPMQIVAPLTRMADDVAAPTRGGQPTRETGETEATGQTAAPSRAPRADVQATAGEDKQGGPSDRSPIDTATRAVDNLLSR